jgi:hypothetical protein
LYFRQCLPLGFGGAPSSIQPVPRNFIFDRLST